MARARHLVREDVRTDMTPMIDVVFLLIVFFLCIEFRVLEAKLPAYLPKDLGSGGSLDPQEKLSVRVVCDQRGEEKERSANSYRLDGHRVHWEIGAERIDGLDRLVARLEEIAGDPAKRQRDPKTGGTKPMTTVVEPLRDTTYGDVAMTVDAVTRAGFTEIRFGSGCGSDRVEKK